MTPVIYLVLTLIPIGPLSANIPLQTNTLQMTFSTLQSCEDAGKKITQALLQSRVGKYVATTATCVAGGVK